MIISPYGTNKKGGILMKGARKNKFKIIFQKIDEMKSDKDNILVASQEVSNELEENSDLYDELEELKALADAKKEWEQKDFFTGT